MPVENMMRNPQKFLGKPSVHLISIGFEATIYFTIGFLGYVRFGETGVRRSIILNLPQNEALAIAAQVFMALGILFTFGLSFYISMDLLLQKIENRIAKYRLATETVIRTAILILMGGLGFGVPNVSLFISIQVAFFAAILGLFMPAFIEIIFLQSHDGFGRLNWRLWKNIFLIFFALVILVMGTFVGIEDIVDNYSGS